METPAAAYSGNGPYIFVCYAHEDAGTVYAEMQWLTDNGVNVWYDEGISAGSIWRAEIGDHIINASAIVYFISKASLASDHCSREINFALDEGQAVLPVYLEEVELTTDLKVGLNRVQALHYLRGDDYRHSLLAALNAQAHEPVTPAVTTDTSPRRPANWLVASAILIASILVWGLWPGSEEALPEPVSIGPSLAVLPFANMSDDPAAEYFSDGVAEDILNALTRLPDLKVIARSSSFQFKGRNEDARNVGQALGVSHLLEGSVRKVGDEVRITAQLVDTNDGARVWSERFQRELHDVFAIQEEIAEAIAAALSIELGVERVARARPVDMRAYELVKLGNYFSTLMTEDGLKRSIQYFEQALEIDPSYSSAHSGLGHAYNVLALSDAEPIEVHFAKAEAAARAALALDETNADAHILMHKVLNREYRREEANGYLLQAVALAPGSVTTVVAEAQHYITVGDINRGVAKSRQALELDPLQPMNHYFLGLNLGFAGDYGAAIAGMKRGLSMGITSRWLIDDLALAYFYAGNEAAAVELFAKHYREPVAGAVRGNYAEGGYSGMLRGMLADLIADTGERCTESPWAASLFYAQLRDAERMFECLEVAAASNRILLIKAHRPFRPYHDDPRYRAILAQVGLN